MILNLETEEFLETHKTAYGLRVVLHERHTRPFPTSEGFTAAAGEETNIGLRLVSSMKTDEEKERQRVDRESRERVGMWKERERAREKKKSREWRTDQRENKKKTNRADLEREREERAV